MMGEQKTYIIVIIGHSGAGKSTLAKKLGEFFSCETLNFSYAGQALASENAGSLRFEEINNYIFQCILAAACRDHIVIVDGLASDKIVHQLSCIGYSMNILFLDTPYDKRIQRMMHRELCSREEAVMIERIKAEGKAQSGLLKVIQNANFRIDGSKAIEYITQEATSYIEKILDN